ncbi:hypothetical protein [Gloeobacter morelensis]|uniref:DUF433 domain-containing protein n=1 Tax=Gloeobacter morelensis MG652769 TaxID=2781736 RepID=A0ABY3PQ53_9CYAN|nr:hypothetical protein [Gloeobacter morelensis]UFP95669.1 hypothetical protein ISF26_05360 [Gloeobacter morelensis MG652769]
MKPDTKRQNFDVTPEQAAQIEFVRIALGAGTAKEAILRSVAVVAVLQDYLQKGYRLSLTGEAEAIRVIIAELEPPAGLQWQYLVGRPHAWRKQLYVKGRRLLASTVWYDMHANGLSIEEAAQDFDLPIATVQEIVLYCESHRELLKMEADEERRLLEQEGIALEPAPAHR